MLLVSGLAVLYMALLRLADALGDSAGGLPVATITLTALAEALAAAVVAVRTRSAVCGLIAAVAGMTAVLAAWEWAFDPDGFGVFRWLLGLGAAGLVLASLALRARSPRHAELLVDAAGLAILAIGIQTLLDAIGFLGLVGSAGLPGFWELVLAGAGFGLVAYGAIDRSPGPAWLGFANLAAFVLIVGLVDAESTLRWWPLLLILVGAVAMAAGLRPRKPLPPEPRAYRAGDAPLASRTEDEEVVLQVRVDDAPPR